MTQDEINAVKKAAEKMRKQESAQDEIIEMARQSGWTDDLLEVSFVSPMLERFAKLVAAKEREACAKVCEQHPDDLSILISGITMLGGAYVACAAAIRARGEA